MTPGNNILNRIDLSGIGFARLDEYFGLWAMESARFRMAWDRASQMDLKAHVEQTQPVKASVRTAAVSIANTPDTFGRQSQSIALIYASGVLMKQVPSGEHGTSTVLLRRVLREAANDDSIAGVVLVIDSPGGTVSGTSDLAADIAQANAIKPVWAFIEDLGTSAAYWCACACDRIVANHRTAAVGSIGTILGLYDASGYAAKEGIEAVVIATGDLKGAGFPLAPITEEQRAYFRRIIDQTQTSFAQAVQDGRGLSAEAVTEIATGEVWLADQAMELGLVDAIQSLDATIDELRQQLADTNNTGGAAAHAQQENMTMPKATTTPGTKTTRKPAAPGNAAARKPKGSSDEQETMPTGKAAVEEQEQSTGAAAADDALDDGGEDEGCDCAGEEGCDCDSQEEQEAPEAQEDAAAEDEGKPKAIGGKPAAKASKVKTSGGKAPSTNSRASEGQKFIDAFGDKGAVWYAQGKSFAEARELHMQALQEENDELKARLEGMDLGASKPLKLSAEGENDTAGQPDKKLAANIGQGLARFASGIKLPKKK